MGVVISSAATESGGTSSVAQAAAAAVTALGGDTAHVDAVINVGVYRDSNLVEPAISALIQQAAGIGLEYRPGDTPCLSFDLMNGACGVVNALGVAVSLLDANPGGRVVILSGDAHPSMRADSGFAFVPVGGALVLENDPAAPGFGAVRVSAGAGDVAAQGYVRLPEMGSSGRSAVSVEQRVTTAELVTHAASAARDALDAAGLSPAEVVLATGRPTAEFPGDLAAALGISTVVTDEFDGDTHTSALTAAYTVARDAGLTGRPLLFVAADAGPTAAAVVYRGRGVA
ncbi:hypothetical protein ACWEQ0_24900 [Nocardia thailandica]|uniref:Beta-ketoacyl-[acyl-carrier-protein] synthase III N-terminal domain-containing protein n=1 Tax=Nocardia thailandica TaxID=257275 RepID=A0ABW6PL63_9NOCA